MPLIVMEDIDPHTRMGVWHIEEEEGFFLQEVPLQRTITHPNKRLQHLAGRMLLKQLYQDFPYELIQIADTRKPYLSNEAYHFSISHCADYAAAIVSKTQRVGVDVETISPKVERVKHKFLSTYEKQLIDELSKGDAVSYLPLLTAAWSMKEALFKWYGEGELDFIAHLCIDQILIQGAEGLALCRIQKNAPISLQVHFKFLGHNCLSWVHSH